VVVSVPFRPPGVLGFLTEPSTPQAIPQFAWIERVGADV
jgi:hypothetical protein